MVARMAKQQEAMYQSLQQGKTDDTTVKRDKFGFLCNVTANDSTFMSVDGDQHNITSHITTSNSNSGNVTTISYTGSNNDSSISQNVQGE